MYFGTIRVISGDEARMAFDIDMEAAYRHI
jgi:hypothetical protein